MNKQKIINSEGIHLRRTLKHRSHIRNQTDEQDLKHWIENKRRNGLRMTKKKILEKVMFLPSRRNKSVSSNLSFIGNFCKRNLFVKSKITRISNKQSDRISLDQETQCKNFRQKFIIMKKQFLIYNDNIYNFNETSLRIFCSRKLHIGIKRKKAN